MLENNASHSARSLDKIIPRWEWRVFDSGPSAAIAALASQSPVGPRSRETYLLSETSPHNAKIRRGTLELKLRLEMAVGGFELWKPVLKLNFPVAPTALGRFWDALSIPQPRPSRETYTEAQFLSELIAATPLVAIRIEKCRRPFEFQGCAAERALLLIGDQTWESVAVEHEDLERLRVAQASLPVVSLAPTNYPAWLKQVTGMPAGLPRERIVLNGVSV